MKTLAHLSAAVLAAWCAACDSAEHHKDAAANYNAGSVADADQPADAANSPPTSDPCKRAQECFEILTRDLCADDECRNALMPPAGNSDQGKCANAVRDARLRATPYTRFRSDYRMPEACRL